MTKKDIKKAKIKKIIFTIINVLCYVCTFLFVLSLVIAVVQSKQVKQSQNVNTNINQPALRRKASIDTSILSIYDNYNDYNFYQFNIESNSTLSVDDQKVLIDFQVNLDEFVTIDSQVYWLSIYQNQTLDNDVYVFSDSYGQCIIKSIYCSVKPYPYSSINNSSKYRFDNLYLEFVTVEGDTISRNVLYRVSTYYGDNIYASDDDTLEIVASGSSGFPNEQLEVFFDLKTPTSFIFNKDFNYNAPLGISKEGAYGDSNFDSSGENMRYKNYNTGYFISNGQLFNQIKYWCIQSAGNSILAYNNGNQQVTAAPTGYWIYSFMYYVNTDTGYEILVNYHESLPAGSSRYYSNNSIWVNDSFRQIIFVEGLSTDLEIQINSFNNNNQNSINGFVGAGSVTDVFTLVGSAFTAWLPIMNIVILPGITLGVLIFIPLVAMLVFAIIRIIKK